jgi:Spy/CpxP family protein refolding chaperone
MQQPGAQCPQGVGPTAGAHQGMGSGMRGGPAATNLADVKTTLKITAEQEGAWNAYAAVVTRHADARNNMRDKMQAQHADPKASLPDRSAMQETMLQFRQEMQTQRTAALKDLYAVLTPEQKTLADQNLNGMRGMRGQGMAGPMGGGRMAHPVGHRMGGQGGMGMGGR